MNLQKKLQEWQRAGVMDAAAAERITQYEKQRSRPVVLWALGGLGAFTIVVGLVSVIAANWMQTPDWIKLSVDLLICLLTAAVLYYLVVNEQEESSQRWLTDAVVVFYYGLVLASMGLIGQTYQLGGSIAKLFLVWSVATLPLVALGRGKLLTALWMVGITTTVLLNLEPLYKWTRGALENTDLATGLVISFSVMLPLYFIAVSRSPWLTRNRPAAASTMSLLAWSALVIGGWSTQFLWYQRIGHETSTMPVTTLLLTAIGFLVVAYLVPRLYPASPSSTRLAMRGTLLIVYAAGATAFWHSRELELVGALSNIAFLFLMSWAALKVGSQRLFSLATALICIRVLIVYFEVFGSMLQTGIGLIIGGVLTLLIAWLWFKKSDALARRFGLSGQT